MVKIILFITQLKIANHNDEKKIKTKSERRGMFWKVYFVFGGLDIDSFILKLYGY